MEKTNKVTFVEVDESADGQRLDNYLLTKLKGVPRSRIYRITRKGEVRVNGGRVKPDYRLKLGDTIRIPPIRMAEPRDPEMPPRGLQTQLETAIIHEDPDFFVLNKPSGLAVHGGSGIQRGLIESLRFMRPLERYLELAHRLDRDTSGCLVVAKKRSALRRLQEMQRRNVITKRYRLLVKGYWPDKQTRISVPLLKNQPAGGERFVRVDPAGKASTTLFKVIEHFDGMTLLEATLVTGRTHQIRVHALHAGHPLAGDEKYGDAEFNRRMKHDYRLSRLFLHACSISIPLDDGGRIRVEAPFPEALESVIHRLQAQSKIPLP